jgi:CubicO group peptidase (beta-lactamase class C family)
MYKLLKVAVLICGGMCTAIVCASAQSARQTANGKSAAAITTAKSGATTPTIDELSGLLPASDFIAIIDAGRAFNELLPRLADLHIDDVDELIKEIRGFRGKTGIDLSKAKNAALGFRIYGKQIIGAAIISGLDGDEGMIEAVMQAYQARYRTAEYKGKSIYITSAGGPWSFSDSQTAIASLGRQKLVLGDLSAVKSVIDIHSGAAKPAVSPAMVAALKETTESDLVRFTINFLESWRREILKQDGFFKSLAAIKLISGSLDTADDLSISLDANFRTASQNEASDLESGLKALVSLIGGYLSGDPKLKGFGALLDLIKIGSQQNDVSLAITAPLSVLRSVTGQATGGAGSGTSNSASTSPVFGFDTRFTSGKSALAIPFELSEYNHIWLRVSVNGSPLSFLLDTGAPGPYPTLSVRAAESLGMKLQFLARKTNVGVGTKPTDFHLVTDKASLSLPGVEISSRSMFAMSKNDCADQATNDGIDRNVPSDQRPKEGTKKAMDGILGSEFFSSFVVEIDYPARLINLYEPQSYRYTGAGESFPIEIDGLIYAQAQVKAPGLPPVTARLAVDTGAATTLTLNRRFAEEHKLLPPPEKLTATNECGIGGLAEGTSYEGRLEALQLGDIKLSNPLTFFRKNPVGKGYDGLLGGGALRHFKVIFDYSRRRMILEPPSPLISASPIKIEQQQSSSQRADAVTGDPENLKRFVGTWKQDPPPDPIHDVAQAVIFKIEGSRLIGMERQYYPKQQWPVTVRQLLAHLGGGQEGSGLGQDYFTPKQVVERIAKYPIKIEPDTKYIYTTSGYNLLGAAIENVSGKSFNDYMRENIFLPLGMIGTRMNSERELIPNRVRTYERVNGQIRVALFVDVSSRFGGGGLIGAVPDLLKWARGVDSGNVLSKDSLDLMYTPVVMKNRYFASIEPPYHGKSIYTLGWHNLALNGQWVPGHGGSQIGTSTDFQRFPSKNMAIAFAANTEGVYSPLFIHRLYELLTDEPWEIPVYAKDRAGQAFYDGLDSAFDYGAAWFDRRRKPFTDDPQEMAKAFKYFNQALNPGSLQSNDQAALKAITDGLHPVADAAFIKVGSFLAAKLREKHGAEREKVYQTMGALPFFADYINLYQSQPNFPKEMRFNEAFEKLIAKWNEDWTRTWNDYTQHLTITPASDIDALGQKLKKLFDGAEVYPNFVWALRNASFQSGNGVKAAKLNLDLYPQHWRSNASWGVYLLLLQRSQGAIEGYRRMFGELGQPLDYFKKSFELNPDGLTSAYMNEIAKGYSDSKRFDDAIALLKVAMELHPKSPILYASLGDLYAQKGEKESAILAYQKALEADPTFERAREMLKKFKP